MRKYCDNPFVNKAIDKSISEIFGSAGSWKELNEEEILNDCVWDFLFEVLKNLNIQYDNKEK